MARKKWGGNPTWQGARAQAALTSIIQTAKQQGKQPFNVLLELLYCPDPQKILDLVPDTTRKHRTILPLFQFPLHLFLS